MQIRPSSEQQSLHAPGHCIRRIMEGQDEGISLSSDLIAIVVGNLGPHDAVMNGGRHLHDLQNHCLMLLLASEGTHQDCCVTLSCKRQLVIVCGDESVCWY